MTKQERERKQNRAAAEIQREYLVENIQDIDSAYYQEGGLVVLQEDMSLLVKLEGKANEGLAPYQLKLRKGRS